MSPPDRGGGGGRGHQPGQDAAVGRGQSHARCPLPPRHSGSGRAGAPGRARGTRWWRKGPPGEGEASGGRGDTQHAGDTGGTRPCVAAVGDTGLRGDQPCAGRRARAGAAPTWPPEPLAHPPCALSPPRCSPGEPCPYLGVPTALLPPPVSLLVAGTGGTAVLPLRGSGGRDGARRAEWGPGTLAGSGAGGAGWGPGTPTGSASHEPSAGAGWQWGSGRPHGGPGGLGVAGGWPVPWGVLPSAWLESPWERCSQPVPGAGGHGGAREGWRQRPAPRCPHLDGHLIFPRVLQRKQTARGWTLGSAMGCLGQG